MKQKLLSTTALITITWFTSFDEIKPTAAAEQPYRASLNSASAINFSSNQNSTKRQLSATLMMFGTGLFSWLIVSNSKYFSHKKLQQTVQTQTSLTIKQSVKEQHNYQNETRDISTYIKRAYSHFKQGDTQNAIEEFNKAIGFNPHNAYLYGERANFRCKNLGDKQGAIEDYSKAICIHPQNALFYLWRSQAYNDIGEQIKAIEDYNTAIRLAPENTMYHYFYSAVNSRD